MNYSRQNPSPRYLELLAFYKLLHKAKIYQGMSIAPYYFLIKKLVEKTASKTILDYGSGKGKQYEVPFDGKTIQEGWNVDSITCYDPAFPPFESLPQGTFDGVICTEVLEHIPEEDIPWVLKEIFSFANKFVYFSVACYPASKKLPNGDNAHCTIKSPFWWKEQIEAAGLDHIDILWELLCQKSQQGPDIIRVFRKEN